MIEFILAFVVFLLLLFYTLLCLFIFFLCFLSNVHLNPAIHRLATTVKRLRLLPGVTTLFRDLYRRPFITGRDNPFQGLRQEAYPWCL